MAGPMASPLAPRFVIPETVPSPTGRRLLTHGGWLLVLAIGIVNTSCASDIGPNSNQPKATISSYETRVAILERQVRDQGATLAAFTPSPATPTAVPFSQRWRIETRDAATFRRAVGVGNGLTPVTPSGVFLVVPITITNLGSLPLMFSSAQQMVVIDGQGRRYDADPRATDAAFLIDFALRPSFAPRQPGLAVPDVIVFDVPTNATDLSVEAIDGSLSIPIGSPPHATPPS